MFKTYEEAENWANNQNFSHGYEISETSRGYIVDDNCDCDCDWGWGIDDDYELQCMMSHFNSLESMAIATHETFLDREMPFLQAA